MSCRVLARNMSRSPRRLLVAAVLFVAVARNFVGAALGQTQVIPIRSGDGLASVWDRRDPAPDGKEAFASVATQAVAIAHTDDLWAGVPLDPAARWIGPGADSQTHARIVHYAAPFTVNEGPISFAQLECVARADGSLARGQVAELRLNDRPVGEIPLATSGAADEWIVFADIAPWLNTGGNKLTMHVPNADLGGAMIFSARVSIWSEVATPEATENPAGRQAAVAGLLGCVGFTCRPRGDLDSDYNVDLSDHDRFIRCLSGAGVPASGECEYADFDCNGRVDLVDVGQFQSAFTGP